MTTLRRLTTTTLAALLLVPATLRPQATVSVTTEVRFTMPVVLVARLAGTPTTVPATRRAPAQTTVPVRVLANTAWQLEVATPDGAWAPVATGTAGQQVVTVPAPAGTTLPLRLRRADMADGHAVLVTLALGDRPVGP